MLPVIQHPTHTVFLPISKKEIKFRPFLSKENRLILIAKEDGSVEAIDKAIKQVLQNCILTKDINIEDLPILDIEIYYYNLSARTKGQYAESKYICEHIIDTGEKCGNILTLSVDLLDLQINNKDVNYDIRIDDNLGLMMKFPKLNIVDLIRSSKSSLEVIYPLLAQCIDYIYDKETVYYTKDVTLEDLEVFLESMTELQLLKVVAWMDNIPTIQKSYEIECDKCGTLHSINLEKFVDFFI